MATISCVISDSNTKSLIATVLKLCPKYNQHEAVPPTWSYFRASFIQEAMLRHPDNSLKTMRFVNKKLWAPSKIIRWHVRQIVLENAVEEQVLCPKHSLVPATATSILQSSILYV